MMPHDVAYTLAAHALLFLTTVAGFIFQWLREGRRHRWQKEQFDAVNRNVKNGHDQ